MLTETQKQIVIVGVILGVVLTIGVFYFYWQLVAPAIQENNTAIAKAETDLESVQERLDEMQAMINNREEWEELQAKVELAKQKLPSDPRALEFLGLLRDGLSKTNVQQTGITREDTQRRPLYREIPYTIEGFARYHDFGQFVNLIECNPQRIMRVNEVRLENNPQRPSFHPMTVGISTFMFDAR